MKRFLCVWIWLFLVSISGYSYAELTESQFKDFVLTELNRTKAEIDALHAKQFPLEEKLREACRPAPGVRNLDLIEDLTIQVEELDDLIDDKFRYQGTLLWNAEKEARERYGKLLRNMIPLPGALDLGIAIWFSHETMTEYGTLAAVGDIAMSSLPDSVQIVGLAIGGGLSSGAIAVASLEQTIAQQQAWIDQYNELMRASDPMRRRVRTRHGLHGAANSLQQAIIQTENAPVMAFDDKKAVHFKGKAKHVQNLRYQLELINELRQYEAYQAGDFNWDKKVDDSDKDIFLQNFGRSGMDWKTSGDLGDIDYDGDVDFADWLYFNVNYR